MKIKDMGRVVTGKTPLTGVNEYYGGNIMFISPSDLHGDYLIEKSEKTITEEGLKSIESNSIDGISVLTGCIGWDMGNVAMCNSRCATNQQINAIIDFNDKLVDPRYVYYWLKGKKDYLFSIASVTRTPILSKRVFENIDIPLPSLKIQERVTKLLSLIDEKIRKNHQINDYLEEMAKTIYDYWFVQFDFPDNCGMPYKSSGGIMVVTDGHKTIPKDWESLSIGNICTLKNGINYEKDIEGDKVYTIVNVRDITASSLFINNSSCDRISLPSSLANKYLISNDSILIARSGTPGAVRLVEGNDDNNIVYCGFIIAATPLDSCYKNYLAFTLKKHEGSNATQTGGSILKNVSQDTLNALTISYPPSDVIEKFNSAIKPILHQIVTNFDEINILIQLRNWLLPMLMNGQATIEDGYDK